MPNYRPSACIPFDAGAMDGGRSAQPWPISLGFGALVWRAWSSQCSEAAKYPRISRDGCGRSTNGGNVTLSCEAMAGLVVGSPASGYVGYEPKSLGWHWEGFE